MGTFSVEFWLGFRPIRNVDLNCHGVVALMPPTVPTLWCLKNCRMQEALVLFPGAAGTAVSQQPMQVLLVAGIISSVFVSSWNTVPYWAGYVPFLWITEGF